MIPTFSPPLSTAQTEHGRDPKFCMVGPLYSTFVITKAIFDISALSRATGVDLGTPRGVKNWRKNPIARLRGEISKIASVNAKLLWRGPTMQNLGSLTCSVWAVGRGGLNWGGGYHFKFRGIL